MPTVDSRTIRVFISSTFRDMQEEREELVKRVFPQLRKLCTERGVGFVDVDLRWGVTDEEAAEGEVLPICLAEIQRCRPFFVGLLGERYGWVPREIPEELVNEQEWLREHRDKSVTELEILHGVLNDAAMSNRALFYFRDPAYLNRLPAEQCQEFREQDPTRRAKLEALKERIRTSGVAFKENYPDPRTLGQWALEDLTVAINQMYPPDPVPDALDRDAADHEVFARSRTAVYIGRQEYLDRLDAPAAGDGPPLVVLGESGSGKSALLANWAIRYREVHPDELVLTHYIGATPDSADWQAMLRRILGEFKRHFDIPLEIPDKPDALRASFANAQHMASVRCTQLPFPASGREAGGSQLPSPAGGRGAGGEGETRFTRIILILDGLNQLEDRDGAPDLVWLPPVIPENVRLIVSTLPGRPLEDLKRRAWPTLTVTCLDPDERRRLIVDYLAQFTKKLSRERTERIASAPQAANPLYLRALLDELKVFGIHEQLDERIDDYLAASSVPDLYAKILGRWEADYERDRPGLVRDAMTALWAARRGLAESELLGLLGRSDQPLPRAHWSPLYLAASESLVVRSGLIGFFHDYLREAVRRRYVASERASEDAHLRLADYFEGQDQRHRRIRELPWQLAAARSWQRLYDLLADLPFFYDAWHVDHFEVKAYWAWIEGSSPYRIVDAYRRVLDTPDQLREFVWEIGILLGDMGHPSEAYRLHEYLVDHYRDSGDLAHLEGALGNQASVLYARGDLVGAMRLYREQERICRELGTRHGLSMSLAGQALILQDRGDLDEAMRLYQEAERICRERGDKKGLQGLLGNQALILRTRGDLDGAMRLHQETERICRELGNKDGLATSLGNQAVMLYEHGCLNEAMRLYREQEQICRALGKRDALLAISLGNQANILADRGHLDGAMRLHQEEERICRDVGNKDGLWRSLANQAILLFEKRNEPRAARPKCQEAIRILMATRIAPDSLKSARELLDEINLRIWNSAGGCAVILFGLLVLLGAISVMWVWGGSCQAIALALIAVFALFLPFLAIITEAIGSRLADRGSWRAIALGLIAVFVFFPLFFAIIIDAFRSRPARGQAGERGSHARGSR